MTTTTHYHLEFFSAATAEDGDDDSSLDITGEILRDLLRMLAAHLSIDIAALHLAFLDRDGDADRYNVTAPSINGESSYGVVYLSADVVKS